MSTEVVSFIHTPYYCEENSYFVAKFLIEEHHVPISSIYIVFISNAEKQVALWEHKASRHPSGLVVWDYHVIVLVKDEGSYMVYDLDIAPKHTPLELAVPCDINTYAATVLSPTTLWPPRRYLIVPAEIFFKHFASDRSHMLTGPSETEQPRPAVRTPQYVAPPPPYPPIVAPDGSTHTLDCYLNMSSNGMEESDRFGIILDEQSFLRWVSE